MKKKIRKLKSSKVLRTIRIYRMNDCDWVAAASLKEAKDEFASVMESDEIDRPRALTQKEMDELIFVEDPYREESSPKMSFRKALNKMIKAKESFPRMFATSEY